MWKYINYHHIGTTKRFHFLIFCIFVTSNLLFAQNSKDFTFISSTVESKLNIKQTTDYLKSAKNNKGEIDVIFTGLFLFYKTFLSSQDLNVCNFHPSCSEFAIQSIKRKGLILGGMKAFDRLGRCNGFSPEKYVIDIERKRLKDPVE